METSVLHSQVAVFEEQDKGLFFVLGLARAAHELLALVTRETPTPLPDRAGVEVTRISAGGQESEDALYFVLGLVSFAGRVEQALDRYEAGPPHPIPGYLQTNVKPPEQPLIRHILR
jgi:hypothetical protein